MEITTVEVSQTNETVATATARQHTILIDRPESVGGTDEGTKARELFLMSLGGCFMNNLKVAIKARNAQISDLHLAITGTADGPPRRFVAIEMIVSAQYEDEALMKKIVTIADRGCLISNTLKHSVDLTVKFHRK